MKKRKQPAKKRTFYRPEDYVPACLMVQTQRLKGAAPWDGTCRECVFNRKPPLRDGGCLLEDKAAMAAEWVEWFHADPEAAARWLVEAEELTGVTV